MTSTLDDARGELLALADRIEYAIRTEGGVMLYKKYGMAVVAALRAAHVPQCDAETDWLPIETAPKDKCVLLCVIGFEPAAGRWWPMGSRWSSFDWEGHFEDDAEADEYFNGSRYEPTHWKPLPKGPLVSSANRGGEA